MATNAPHTHIWQQHCSMYTLHQWSNNNRLFENMVSLLFITSHRVKMNCIQRLISNSQSFIFPSPLAYLHFPFMTEKDLIAFSCSAALCLTEFFKCHKPKPPEASQICSASSLCLSICHFNSLVSHALRQWQGWSKHIVADEFRSWKMCHWGISSIQNLDADGEETLNCVRRNCRMA